MTMRARLDEAAIDHIVSAAITSSRMVLQHIDDEFKKLRRAIAVIATRVGAPNYDFVMHVARNAATNSMMLHTQHGLTPVMLAASCGQLLRLEEYLQAGWSVDAVDEVKRFSACLVL